MAYTTLAPHSLPIWAPPLLDALKASPYYDFQKEDVTISLRHESEAFARHPVVLQRGLRILQKKLRQASLRIKLLEIENASLRLSRERISRGERGDGRARRLNAGRRFAAR